MKPASLGIEAGFIFLRCFPHCGLTILADHFVGKKNWRLNFFYIEAIKQALAWQIPKR